MENILYNISQVLGITIINSLWQGLLIYFLLKLVLALAPGLSSAKKYLIALSSLIAVTIWFSYTMVTEITAYNWLAVKPANLAEMPMLTNLTVNLNQLSNQSVRYYYSIEGYLPYITVVYLFGLLLNAGRLFWGRKRINTIKHTMSLDVVLQQQITHFADKFGITKKVKVGLSKMVDVPCIVGYVKPVILLPFTLTSYLTDDEIVAILMHELAHIQRNDYLVNVAQQIITTLLFFNPCVLLINKIIGEERENSCDDLVVDTMQSPIIYARALFKLEQTRQNELQLALAVTGKKYHLLNRIERIMKTKKQIPSIRPTLVAMLILTAGIGCLALLNPEIAQGRISVKAVQPAIESLFADTTRKSTAKVAVKANKAAVKARYKLKKSTPEYSYSDAVYYTKGLKDPELDRLAANVDKHANVISKYYEAEQFKGFSADLEKRGKEIGEFYDNDRVKSATANQQKAAAAFEKAWGSQGGKMDAIGKQMEIAGKKMGQYFDSKEFKDINTKLGDKYRINVNGIYDPHTERYAEYRKELDKYIPADIKARQDEMKSLGDEMKALSQSPDILKYKEDVRAAGEEMRKAYDNPDIKLKQEEMRRLGDKMRAYTDNAQIKKEQELLRQSSEKLRAYTNTPEFKAKLKEWRKNNKEAFNWNSDVKEPEVAVETPLPVAVEVVVPPVAPEAKEAPVKP